MQRDKDTRENAPPLLPRAPEDAVPRLRRDLLVTPNPRGAVLFDAVLPGTERVLGLYEYEVSIARMLDGRRSASALVAAAAHIGIPLSFESLGTFLRRLHAYDFLEAPGTRSANGLPEHGPWAPRVQWTPEIRAHFQSALRAFREERFEAARAQLDALAKLQPDLPEASSLRARIDERLGAGAGLTVTTGPAIPRTMTAELPSRARPKRRRVSALAAAVGTAAVLGILGVPLPYTVSAEVSFEPAVVHALSASADAKVVLLAERGAEVSEGTAVLQLVSLELSEERARLEAELQGLEAKRLLAAARADSAEAKLEAARVERARTRLARARSASMKSAREAELLAATATFRERSGAAEVEALEVRQEAVAHRLAELEHLVETSVLRAPITGTFSPQVEADAQVRRGEALGQVADAREVRARIPLEASELHRVHVGRPVSLELPTGRILTAQVSAVEAGEAGRGHALVVLPAPSSEEARLLRATAKVHCQSAPALSHLLGLVGL